MRRPLPPAHPSDASAARPSSAAKRCAQAPRQRGARGPRQRADPRDAQHPDLRHILPRSRRNAGLPARPPPARRPDAHPAARWSPTTIFDAHAIGCRPSRYAHATIAWMAADVRVRDAFSSRRPSPGTTISESPARPAIHFRVVDLPETPSERQRANPSIFSTGPPTPRIAPAAMRSTRRRHAVATLRTMRSRSVEPAMRTTAKQSPNHAPSTTSPTGIRPHPQHARSHPA